MVSETGLLESAVSEYRALLDPSKSGGRGRPNLNQLVRRLASEHDWTENGARAVVGLANDYGAFMLRNALALAVALEKEDGELGF